MTDFSNPISTSASASAGQGLDQVWGRVRARLRADLGDAVFNSWLKLLTLDEFDQGQVVLSVPTRFMRDWVANHYADRIREIWRKEYPGLRGVQIRVRNPEGARDASRPEGAEDAAPSDAPAAVETPGEAPGAPALQRGLDDSVREMSAPLDRRYTFDTFIVGKSNELAHAAARRVAEADAVPFNPLFLYGGVGLGKTHLMHAIGWELRRRYPEKRVVYLSAEKFTHEFIRSIRYRDTMAFKEQMRSIDVLMIDDVQFIAGKEQTQEEFFHTFNALREYNRQIIISADRSPSDLERIEERMKSRLGGGLVADLLPTDFELRLAILQAKCERENIRNVPQKVLEFLAHRIVSNVRVLEGAMNRIVAYSDLVGRPVTLESAQDVLRDLLRASERRVSIEDIQKRVAEHYNIKLTEMHSSRRARIVARPRQVAMYLAKQLTSRSLPEIGRKFGRDHTTVMHAVKKVEELRQSDASFAEDIDLLRRMLEA